MGSGNVDVGNKDRTRKPGQPMIESLAAGAKASSELRVAPPKTIRIKRPAICGAMSQQCGDSGNFSTPQKFVQLVGCREPKAQPEPWVRPGPTKRS